MNTTFPEVMIRTANDSFRPHMPYLAKINRDRDGIAIGYLRDGSDEEYEYIRLDLDKAIFVLEIFDRCQKDSVDINITHEDTLSLSVITITARHLSTDFCVVVQFDDFKISDDKTTRHKVKRSIDFKFRLFIETLRQLIA